MSRTIIIRLVLLCGVLVLFFAAGWYFYPHYSFKSAFTRERTPELYYVPTQRVLTTLPYNYLEYPGYSLNGVVFRSPWNERPEKIEREHILFSPGREISIVRSPDVLALNSTDLVNGQVTSPFERYKVILSKLPSEITWSTSRSEVLKFHELMLQKENILKDFNADIHEFSTFRGYGFQLGGESEGKKRIIFYDLMNNRFDIVIHGSQRDVDFILQSLRVIR